MKDRDKPINLLVEFNFLVDLDLAMFKLVRAKYNNPDYVDRSIISLKDDKEIIKLLLDRKEINPLTVIIPNMDTTVLYTDLITLHEHELLQYAKATDMFGLMITYLNVATSIKDIVVRCDSLQEVNFIKSLNSRLTCKVMRRQDVDLEDYSVIYCNYYPYMIEYKELNGKQIYIANAGYNMDVDHPNLPSIPISSLVADVNIVHTIDLYKDIQYINNIIREGEDSNE